MWNPPFDTGQLIVDIGEILAGGTRKDSEVYIEMRRRVAALPEGPQTKTFEEVLVLLQAGLTKKRRPTPSHPTTDDTLAPTWLVDDLVNLAGYVRSDVEALTERQAMSAWMAYRSR